MIVQELNKEMEQKKQQMQNEEAPKENQSTESESI